MTLTATNGAAEGTSSFTVTGTTGIGTPDEVSHSTSGQVKVDFGLVPVCYGAAEGTVRDAYTNDPIAGVKIDGGAARVTTDAAGHYRVDRISLGENNSPQEFTLFMFDSANPGYWFATATAIAFCDPDHPTQLDITLFPIWFGSVSGRVVEGTPRAPDYSTVDPTSTPIEGATVHAAGYMGTAPPDITGADGQYAFSFHLNRDNQPANITLYASSDQDYRHGYWQTVIPLGEIERLDPPLTQQIALVKKCTGSISGKVIYGDTGAPAVGVTVRAANSLDGADVVTRQDGSFTVPELLLGYNNAPTGYGLSVVDPPPGYGQPDTASVEFGGCGAAAEVTLVLRPFQDIYGAIEGRVIDEETGDPLAGVDVSLPFACPCDTTETDGSYRLEGIFMGRDGEVFVPEVHVSAGHVDYYRSGTEEPVALEGGGTVEAPDIEMLRRRFGTITGVVRDQVSGLPIIDASVSIGSASRGDTTDAAGRYLIDQVPLGDRNESTEVTVEAVADGYWRQSRQVTVVADTPKTQDFDLLKICRGATVSGRVVNAETGAPIQDATVSGGGESDLTDENGEYVLADISVGTDNSPVEVAITASKQDFYSQTKRVTVFCGASIALDFGPEPPRSAIEGYVTNDTTGMPIADVFIGSEFGGAIRTDENGYYKLVRAPLNPDGTARTWTVTAEPSNFPAQTKSVLVEPDRVARLDFAFGEPRTATMIVAKVTDPAGDPAVFTFTGDAAGAIRDGETTVVSDLSPGNYAVTESVPSGWDLTRIFCDDADSSGDVTTATATFRLAAGETVTCTFTDTKRGSLVIEKRTVGASDSFGFTSTGELPSPANASGLFTISTANTNPNQAVFNDLSAGDSYTVAESFKTGWDLTDLSCAGGSNSIVTYGSGSTFAHESWQRGDTAARVTLGAGETTTCIYTNIKRGTVVVHKTLSGLVPPSGTTFRFQLRTGASTSSEGTVLATASTDAAGNIASLGGLLPPNDYQLCETAMQPGWHSSLEDMQGAFVPNAVDPMHDNSTSCIPLTLAAGQERTFSIDNTPPPGGDARTIGFWKNWSSCSGGRQKPILDQTLSSFPLNTSTGTHGIYIGNLFVDTCREAASILSKSTLSGAKKASDAGYGLGAQLLATLLNVQAKAGTCSSQAAAAADGSALLEAIGFTATGDYLGPKVKGSKLQQRARALTDASTLDRYNNNSLC